MTASAQQQQASRARVPSIPVPSVPLFWTPQQISDALGGSSVANITTQWPLVCQALADFGILDKLTAVAAAATIGVEAHNFWPIEEYRNADGSYPSYWYDYDGGPLHHGYGLVQLTHLYNHVAVAQDIYTKYGIYLDLVNHPELLLEPRWSAFALAWFFANHGIPFAARVGWGLMYEEGPTGWTRVREIVNGGHNGLDDFLGYVQALLKF